jgi:hypothetical protein
VSTSLRETNFFDQLASEGVSRKNPMDAFFALFPDVFELYGSGQQRSVQLKD